MANRFSVPVGQGYGKLLTEFGDRMVQSGERRDEKEGQKIKQEYLAEMKSEASKAYNSGDIDAMINVSLSYPEISGSMSAAMQHKSERTEQNYQDVLFDFYVDPTEQNATDIIAARQTMLGEEGADSAETDGFLDKVRTDPVKAQKEIEKELAFRYPDKMKKLMEMTKDTKGTKGIDTKEKRNWETAKESGYKGTFADFLNMQKPTQEMQHLKAMGIEPDDPRYSELYEQMVLGVPEEEVKYSEATIDRFAREFITTGKKVINARGKENNKLNRIIQLRAAEIQEEEGISAANTFFNVKDREALTGSIAQQEKNYGMMKSYISNLKAQIVKTKELTTALKHRFGTKIFNKPISFIKDKIMGDPSLSKYNLYLTEIPTELAKITGGATGSVAEPSEGSQKKWDKVFDGSLGYKAMNDLLDEAGFAAGLRLKSVSDALDETRKRRSDIGGTPDQQSTPQAPQGALDKLKSNPGMAEFFRKKYGYLPEGY